MTINNRRYRRYPISFVAERYDQDARLSKCWILEISLGGCFAEWFDEAELGAEIKLELPLPNQNTLPVTGKIVYRFTDVGVGVRFLGLTRFEQELIADLINTQLAINKMPPSNPFATEPAHIAAVSIS